MFCEYAGPATALDMVSAGLLVFGAALLPAVAVYVLRSWSVYTIAKRRGLNKPWLAWIPVGHGWLLGSVSDQYKYLTRGKDQYRRMYLLGLQSGTILATAAALLCVAALFSWKGIIAYTLSQGQITGLGLIAVVLLVLWCGCAVMRYLSLYDLYKSCEPKNAKAYLVLGILFGAAEPLFLLACRNKDLGMPPRKPMLPDEIPEP